MARRIWLAAIAIAGCGDDARPPPGVCEPAPQLTGELAPFEQHRFVAHAGGSPGGLRQSDHYSNSREAFDLSYRNGFRAFEFDLIRLADGTVLVAHDHHEDRYGLDIDFPDARRRDVEGLEWEGAYPLLFAQDLIDLMVEHPDVWIILDTKWDELEIAAELVRIAPDDDVRRRMVPHLVSAEHAAAIDSVFPFPEQMIAVYRWQGSDDGLVARMAGYGVDNIMMWWDSRWNETLQANLAAAGNHVWVHTPDEPAVLDRFVADGIGVYSNGYIDCRAP